MVFGADAFFSVRVTHSDVNTDGHEELERSIITGHRWWTVAELRETTEYVSPPGLSDLVASLLADGIPVRPVRLPARALLRATSPQSIKLALPGVRMVLRGDTPFVPR